jgi:hypothetical protein
MVKIHMHKYAKQMVTKICNINMKRAYKSMQNLKSDREQ